MKSVIPFSKEIVFKTNIAEISSISLEHNYDIKDSAIKGEFVITGEYKSHELSVNKESFKYSLPFDIDIDDDILNDTIKMEIEDFTYDFHDDILNVMIEYSLIGERVKEERKEIIIPDAVEVENPKVFLEEANNLIEGNENNENREEEVDCVIEPDEETEEERKEEEMKEEIQEKSEYVTYHVHVLKEEETIEAVCKMYDVSMSLVEEYNDLTDIGPKDKIIIPIYQDE